MKDATTFEDAVHAELIELLSGEDPALGRGSPDTKALAVRLCQLARTDKVDGFALAELEHRSKLICSIANLGVKGKPQRVTRLVECFARALAAALKAVME
jgi:hypothetical protein